MVKNDQIQRYYIENPNQKTIVWALEHLPKEPPESLYFEFTAYGLNIPSNLEDNEIIEAYINLCTTNIDTNYSTNIIPFSKMKINSNLEIESKIGKNIKKMQNIFSGGKINEILIDFSKDLNEEKYDLFKKILFPSLKDASYNIDHGYVLFESDKLGDNPNNQSSVPKVELNYNWGHKGLVLMTNPIYTSTKDIEKYLNWFNDLKKKSFI